MTSIAGLRPGIAVRPTVVGKFIRVLIGAAGLALAARANLPLPFTPVPITLQTLAVLLIGGLLGPTLGVASVTAYLAAGAAGAPVFANGAGAQYLLGATGGYLLGLLPAAWVCGTLIERGWARPAGRLLAAMLLADATLFAFGLACLALHFPLRALPLAGLVPFIPGEVLKILLAGIVLRRAHR